MKTIDQYTQKELVELYRKQTIYATTWMFKYYRTYKMKPEEKDKPFILWWGCNFQTYVITPEQESKIYNEGIICNLDDVRCWSSMRQKNNNRRIEELKCRSGNTLQERNKLVIENAGISVIKACLHWCYGGGDYSQMPEYEEDEEYDQLLELHMNDASNIKDGIATDYQSYLFVWETLQYLDIQQLKKLLKFADQGYASKWEAVPENVGRKSKVCEIRQVNIDTGKTVKTYMTRNDLIDKTGIKKSHLSQCIKTSKENPENRDAWKKWIGEDGEKYGFVEVQQTNQ